MRTDADPTTSEPDSAARAALLDGLPVRERRLELAGVSTALLEGGDGPPVVLLHDPGEFAEKWAAVLPDLVGTHTVIAPDLPGHGRSTVTGEPLDPERVLAWLGELVEATCPAPPALVGLILGGAVAARFAADHSDRLDHLVLVDSLGLTVLDPAPAFAEALEGFLADPTEATYESLWQQCAFDLDGMQERMGERWAPFTAYNLELVREPSVQSALHALMEHFAVPAIPAEALERITVPTTMIWGRQDLATRLEVAQAASSRYGWPLHVIDDCGDDPPLERPEEFMRALRVALGRTVTRSSR